MKKSIIICFCLTMFLISSFARSENKAPALPKRIVSLSPAITEILYELGLGDKVVGVTDYCVYPEDVNDKFRVGGYLNTNYEAIIFLKPDLVISPSEYDEEIKKLFDAIEAGYIMVNTQTLDDILIAIEDIGSRCGVKLKAEEIAGQKRNDMISLKERAKQRSGKRIMVVVGRNRGSLENVYIAGKRTFYNDIIEALGCENVYTKDDISYPAVSVEAMMRLDPDIIIEMAPNCPEGDKPEIIKEWKSIETMKAVKNNDIYVLNGDYVSIPGPRFTLILKDIEEIL